MERPKSSYSILKTLKKRTPLLNQRSFFFVHLESIKLLPYFCAKLIDMLMIKIKIELKTLPFYTPWGY